MSNNCKYCGNERVDAVSCRNHERMCRFNPDRKISVKDKSFYKTRKNSNQYLKARELGLPDPNVSYDTRKILSQKSKSIWDDDRRADWSVKMKEQSRKNIENHPESYSYKNFCGRSKKTLYKEQWMHSSWELSFAIWLDENNVKWTKKVASFDYFWKGANRKYFPDFYLPDFDKYVEVKGYETDRDIEKWKSVPGLVVLKEKEINQIKRKSFDISRIS